MSIDLRARSLFPGESLCLFLKDFDKSLDASAEEKLKLSLQHRKWALVACAVAAVAAVIFFPLLLEPAAPLALSLYMGGAFGASLGTMAYHGLQTFQSFQKNETSPQDWTKAMEERISLVKAELLSRMHQHSHHHDSITKLKRELTQISKVLARLNDLEDPPLPPPPIEPEQRIPGLNKDVLKQTPGCTCISCLGNPEKAHYDLAFLKPPPLPQNKNLSLEALNLSR